MKVRFYEVPILPLAAEEMQELIDRVQNAPVAGQDSPDKDLKSQLTIRAN